MISCNEFKLGNYILVEGSLRQICMINNDRGFADIPYVGFYEGDGTEYEKCNSPRVEAVPMNEKIMEQCGFLFHEYFNFWQKIETISGKRMEMDIDTEYQVLDFLKKPVFRKLTSLHQLQNIYYDLTGNELDVKQATRHPAAMKRETPVNIND